MDTVGSVSLLEIPAKDRRMYIDRRMGGWMVGWMDGWMDGWKD